MFGNAPPLTDPLTFTLLRLPRRIMGEEEAAAVPASGDKKSGGVGGSSIVTILRHVLALLLLGVTVHQCQTILTRAYTIRLHAIETYGYSE